MTYLMNEIGVRNFIITIKRICNDLSMQSAYPAGSDLDFIVDISVDEEN